MSALFTGAKAITGARSRTAIRLSLASLVVGQLLTGLVLGLVWLSWAPQTQSYLLSNGTGGSFVIPAESESQVAGDGRYVVLSVLAGLVFGLLAWRLRSVRGPVVVVVLAVSSVLSSLLMVGTGRLFASGSGAVSVNSAFHPRLTLHAGAAIWLQALFAVLVYTVFVGLSSDPSLGRGDSEAVPEQPASS